MLAFFLLFFIAFVIGLVSYVITDKWHWGVIIALLLFLANTLLDIQQRDGWVITLIFGAPIVFFASLFGAYIVQLRRGEDEEPSPEQDDGSVD